MRSDRDVKKDELLEKMNTYLYGWALKDIKRASIDGEAKMAGFILGACFIDALAGFWEGVDKDTCKNNIGDRFKGFIGEYLPQYNQDHLWKDLRNYLVHSYTEGGSYVFTDNEKEGRHFDKHSSGRTILNLEDFYYDLEKAYKNLVKDIEEKEESFLAAKKRYDSMGLIESIP